MKKNLSVLMCMLACWPIADCTVDHNDAENITTVESPEGDCYVTVLTNDYNTCIEMLTPAEGNENLQEVDQQEANG